MKDLYNILGITSQATSDEIKTAYKKLSMKFHPDMNKGDKFFEEKFKEILTAYETLSDSVKRANYDFKYEKWQNEKSTKSSSTSFQIFLSSNQL